MTLEFLGSKRKAIIAMAHIGALPGAPGYDAEAASTSWSRVF